MVVIALMVVGGIVMVTLVAFALLRGWGTDLQRTETELHQPDAHAEAFAVPPGQDPAVLMGVLRCAGYVVVEENPDRLLVACPSARDAERVRHLLEHTYQH